MLLGGLKINPAHADVSKSNPGEPESKLLKGGYMGIVLDTIMGVIKGYSRSLDDGSDE